MKVEKILCDICGEEIRPVLNNGYKMIITAPSYEKSIFNGGEMDVCEKCLSVLRDTTIKRGNKDFYVINNKLIKHNLTPAVWN